MKHWWSNLSLKNKLQVPVQLVLMLILLTGQHFAFLWLEGRMVDDAKQKAVISGEMALRTMNALMLLGEIGNPESRKKVMRRAINRANLRDKCAMLSILPAAIELHRIK